MIRRRSASPAPIVPVERAQPPLSLSVEKAARVEIDLADARGDLADAECELVAARRAYDVAVDGARLSEAVAARSRIAEVETRADIARRLVKRLEAELGELLAGAEDAAAAAERDQLRATAEAALASYRAAFEERMPALTAGLRELIRMHATAEVAREAAAEVGVALPRADAFRDIQGSPRVVLARRELDLWLNEYGGTPFGDEDQKLIRVRSDGVGTLQGNNYLHEATRRRRFEEIDFIPLVSGEIAPPLSEHLTLPCLRAGEPAGWSPMKHGTRARDVLRALDEFKTQVALLRPEPIQRTERRPLEPARDVRLNPEKAPSATVERSRPLI